VHCNTSVITEKGKAKLLAKHTDLAKYFPEAEKKSITINRNYFDNQTKGKKS
jgi:hypothetical protein